MQLHAGAALAQAIQARTHIRSVHWTKGHVFRKRVSAIVVSVVSNLPRDQTVALRVACRGVAAAIMDV
jgi:hypothetical protein